MTTYIQKGNRLFLDRGDIKPERRRSEARLKTYPSAIDVRAWCDIVEDRRQHILELVNKGRSKCLGKLIPIEAIIDALLAGKIENIKKLQNCLNQLWKFIESASLNNEDKEKLVAIRQKMDSICAGEGKSEALQRDKDAQGNTSDECVAKARHERELAEVEALTKTHEDTYKVTTKGPARIITRVKGIRPGFKVAPGTNPVKTVVTNAFPNSNKNKAHIQPEKYQDQSRQGLPQGQSHPGSPKSQTRQESPQGQTRQVSPRGESRKVLPQGQSRQGSPRGQSHKELPQGQSRQESPRDQSRQVTAQGQSRQAQPSAAYNQELSEHLPQGGSYMEEPSRLTSMHQECSELIDSIPLSSSRGNKEDQIAPIISSNFNIPAFDETKDPKIQIEAREALCNELQMALENIKNERDEFRKKFETTLEELEAVKKLNAASPIIPTSCKEEIEALELEIKVMRRGNLSPEQEAEVIRKEVEVLKKYCLKLKSVEDENEKLRFERDNLKSQVTLSGDGKTAKDNLNRQVAGILEGSEKRNIGEDISKDRMETSDIEDLSKMDLANIDELKCKLKNLEAITRERDMLANKVQRLETELLQYRDLPEDLEVYRNRSKMLDSALEERDKMSRKVDQIKGIEDELNQLRKKSARVDELEEELKLYSKNDKNIGSDLKKTKSRCTCLEKELQNVKMERDSMRTRIEYMKKEMETLKAKTKETEIYKLERDRLQMKLNELSHIQVQHENLMVKCKCLENAAAEKEMYKQKYEDVITMESQGDVLRSKVEAAKNVERERNSLVKQVGDLESCICDQEDEIKKLVLQIDNLCRCKDDNQCRMREALASMRAEIEKKDCLIAESEQKISAVQAQLKSSIQGVSCETTCYKTRIEDLERELRKSQLQIETLQKQLNKKDISLKGVEKLTKSECESVAAMKRELHAAKAENKKLREIANKMVALTGDEHVQNMLRQSECAVKRIVEELGRQYKEWDNMKINQKKGIYAQVNKQCPCKHKHLDTQHLTESESNEKLIEELEDIQREKEKLEQLVKQIQNDQLSVGPQNELVSLRIENAKLQDQLQKEMKQRKDLERKFKIVA